MKRVIYQDAAAMPNLQVWKLFVLEGRYAGKETEAICQLSKCSESVAKKVCAALEAELNEADHG